LFLSLILATTTARRATLALGLVIAVSGFAGVRLVGVSTDMRTASESLADRPSGGCAQQSRTFEVESRFLGKPLIGKEKLTEVTKRLAAGRSRQIC
jgi:hypothetical protein